MIGAILYVGVGLFYSGFMLFKFGFDMISAVITLGIPAILIGIMFWLTHHRHLV